MGSVKDILLTFMGVLNYLLDSKKLPVWTQIRHSTKSSTGSLK